MTLAAVIAVVGSLVIAGIAGPSHAGASASRHVSAAEVTIEAPGVGTSTSARSITVSGTVSPSPVDYNTSITVSVNGRLYEAIPESAAYGVEVALERGVNQIITTAEIEPPRDAEGEPVGVPEVAGRPRSLSRARRSLATRPGRSTAPPATSSPTAAVRCTGCVGRSTTVQPTCAASHSHGVASIARPARRGRAKTDAES
jgi:hypothetical protein